MAYSLSDQHVAHALDYRVLVLRDPSNNRTIQLIALVDASGNVISPTGISVPSAIVNFSGEVTVAATAVRITTAATTCKAVRIYNKDSNTGRIWVGDSSVAQFDGEPIYPGAKSTFEIDDVSKLYICADGNTHAFSGVYFT